MSIVTTELLGNLGCIPEVVRRQPEHINRAMEVGGIKAPLDQACFLATCLHECSKYTRRSESLNYTPKALLEQWPNRFTPELANTLGRRPGHLAQQKQIAITAYGGRLGNKPAPSTHGWDYRGAGDIQLTGLSNFTAFNAWLKLKGIDHDVVTYPDLVQGAELGALAGAWFWSANSVSRYGEPGKIIEVSALVNTGKATTAPHKINGLDERISYFRQIKAFAGLK